ncbi:MAG: YdcH family protein [Nitrospinae bacterium]|nr:YdcH family protein [Nitrospinota bacterium]
MEATEKMEETLNEDDELTLLKKEHSVLDEKILSLEEIRFPSPEEQQQIKRLKKEKLAIKTQLEKMEKS